MRVKAIIVLAATVLMFALGIKVGLSQEKKLTTSDTAKIIYKIDEVLANQAEILKQFDEIRKELAIIKVRASR